MYPAAILLSPNVALYEKVCPGLTTVPFNFPTANLKFVVLSEFPPSYFVEYEPNKSGKASDPNLSVVILGIVIFNGIVYSFFSSSIIFFASSILIAKSTPFTCGYIVNGSFV